MYGIHRSALTGLCLSLCACAITPPPAAEPEPPAQRAGRLSQSAIIIDTHIDVPYRMHLAGTGEAPGADGDFDAGRARLGGLDAAFMSIYIPARVDAQGHAGEFADAAIALVEELAAQYPDDFALATCTDDVRALAGSGRIALPLGMENGGPIAGSLTELQRYAERGIRYITLAHSRSNHISDSSYDPERRWDGLSPFGRELILHMNALGVMVDVSHLSDAAFWQVLELSQTPVLATHSSLRHFTPGWERNMSDEMVTALARQGGVIQINFGSGFLTEAARAWSDAQQAAADEFKARLDLADDDLRVKQFYQDYREQHPYPYANLTDVLDHIDRAVALAGVDHVGIGSDYDGVGDSLPEGLKDVSSYPNLVAGLLERGYTERDVRKILGENTLRVWAENERFAAANGNPAQCRNRS